MDMKVIAKRWFLVAGAITFTPFLFQKAFQCLNWVSDKLVGMGADNMNALALAKHFTTVDVVVMLIFDAILVSTVIPVLWKNGRRFFDLMVLGVISPLALSAWIFDDKRHLFQQWWGSVKHLSMVQVYYALFLLVIGWFIFGVPNPTTFTGLCAKILVVIGGFGRMVNPPRIIARHLDAGQGMDETVSGSRVVTKVKGNFKESKAILKKATFGLATKGTSLPLSLVKGLFFKK
jgi:hypothetical protein